MKRTYAGEFLEYFLAKDREFPFHYAFGIRHSEIYGTHLVRTAPITSVNLPKGRLYTMFCVYNIHQLIVDKAYKAQILLLFENRVLPFSDDELIYSTVSLYLH